MTEFKPGDKIRVTYEAVYEGRTEYGNYRLTRPDHDLPEYMYELSSATVELVERADSLKNDPIGTVRRSHHGMTYVRVPGDDRPWHGMEFPGSWNRHGGMRDSKIVGAVPGTPAAEAAKPAAPKTVNTGDPEPPRDARYVDTDGDVWSYRNESWRTSSFRMGQWDPFGWAFPWTLVSE